MSNGFHKGGSFATAVTKLNKAIKRLEALHRKIERQAKAARKRR